ncbi:hypothetical protein DSO57_1008903 [Entomophthora muscae]|uniref:Uncharacterized protein n=1 Tax=Entomophthora muscae TaxID=34485 RepID=A0ACC2SK15_9FUNG|nr:hypothetical protein DSO57_1008903 [Entomophthora muscae]
MADARCKEKTVVSLVLAAMRSQANKGMFSHLGGLVESCGWLSTRRSIRKLNAMSIGWKPEI